MFSFDFDVSRDADVSAEQTHDEDEWVLALSDDGGTVQLRGDGAGLIALLEKALDVLRTERSQPQDQPYSVVNGRVIFKEDGPDPQWLDGIDLSVLDA